MAKIRLVFWDGPVNESNVINIYEFDPIKLKTGKFNNIAQECFDEAVEWKGEVIIKKVKDD